MPSPLEQIVWILKQAAKPVRDDVAYYSDNPSEIPGDVWDWMKENKVTCIMIVSGVLVIAVPPLIGFGAAGPAAGSFAAWWQSCIGNVAAGSLFATIQSWAMTGVFTTAGASMIGAGGIWKILRSIDGKFLPGGGSGPFGGLSGLRGGLPDSGAIMYTDLTNSDVEEEGEEKKREEEEEVRERIMRRARIDRGEGRAREYVY